MIKKPKYVRDWTQKERENIYMQNLYEDLKSDTAIYSAYEKSAFDFFLKIDSMESLMKAPINKSDINKIYFVARTATMRTTSIHPNNRTFDEMKNAGLLRLIDNRQLADSISYYYNSLEVMVGQNQVLRDRITDYMGEMSRVFDAQYLLSSQRWSGHK